MKDGQPIEIPLPEINPPKGNKLRDAVRVYLVDKYGKTKPLPKKYENDPNFIRITDENLYKELFGKHEHCILNEFENYACYVHKESNKFVKSSELKEKYNEVLAQNKEKLFLYLAMNRRDIKENAADFLDSLNFYQLQDLVKEMEMKNKAKKEEEKKEEEKKEENKKTVNSKKE